MTWLYRLWLRWHDRHDPAAIMQNRPQPSGGYDYAKAQAGYKRAQAHSATGKPLPKPRKARARGNVTPMRKHA